jgi:PhoH-like ATPase
LVERSFNFSVTPRPWTPLLRLSRTMGSWCCSPATEEDYVARTYILDTNVLIFDPKSLFVFEEHNVIVPMLVMEEIDRFKSGMDERGRNARTASRYLDKLRERGSLREGVPLHGGGTLKVMAGDDDLTQAQHPQSTDNAILSLATRLKSEASDDDEVVLISRDTNMRIKGDAMGVQVEDYRHDDVIRNIDDQYTGYRTLTPDMEGVFDKWYGDGKLDPNIVPGDLHPHEFLILTDGAQKSALVRTSPQGMTTKFRKVDSKKDVWGIHPRNKEQVFALDLLCDPTVSLVTLSGQAGTGKTLLAIAAGLSQVCGVQSGDYRKLLVARPIFPMGKDLGYLPGDLNEKLNPWMQPIFDNLDFIISGTSEEKDGMKEEKGYRYLFDRGYIDVEALTYIRGRSIPEQFIIVDEAQNLTPHEVKTILTRAGEGTKIVLTGDPNQIDNPYVDGKSNGLTYVIERFKDSPLAGHVSLTRGERSELAQAASELL